jgi:hypothetical protein
MKGRKQESAQHDGRWKRRRGGGEVDDAVGEEERKRRSRDEKGKPSLLTQIGLVSSEA